MQTSVADRTSPVQRGKWIMEVFLGSPPPPPPPNVPPLDDTKAATADGHSLSTRERMEEHRKNPACASCHRVIDPLGLALENFDVTGAWRIRDNMVPVDSNGTLYDGTQMAGPAGLREALLKHSDTLIRNFTENLMSYALGRRVEYYDEPTIRAITRKAAQNDNHFSEFVFGIVDSPAFQMAKAEPAVTTSQRRIQQVGANTMSYHLEQTHFASSRSEGNGRHRRAAVPRRDGSGRAASSPARRRRRRPGCRASRWCTDRRAARRSASQKNLWAPAKVGRDFDLSPSSLAPLAPFKEYLTVVSNTDVRNAEAFKAAGNRRRSLPLRGRVPDAVASEADAGLGRPRRHVDRPDIRAEVRPGHGHPVDAAVHRGGRPGRRLRLRLFVRLHGHDQLVVARPAAADGPRPARRVRSTVRRRCDAGGARREPPRRQEHPRLDHGRGRAAFGVS